ncbi:fibronectin type III domain-containing protein [Larkinella soli]|uniref:fibronectin type III domain-containing protein n=1 Tax=Larkinella soli TaxID=1770527 RepID=UPI000FFB2273|nr:fibronectin type III domain-containing protein [Larkinella soli]
MNTAKIATGFSRLRERELEHKARHILSCLTDNPAFPRPIPSLADIRATLDAYSAALISAIDGSPEDLSFKRQKRAQLEGELNLLALYVQVAGHGKREVLLTSGFDLSKIPWPIEPLPRPQNFRVEPGNRQGSVRLSVQGVDGAVNYLFQYASLPVRSDSDWVNFVSFRAQAKIDNLTSGKQYVFRVAGVGSHPVRVFSEEVCSVVT